MTLKERLRRLSTPANAAALAALLVMSVALLLEPVIGMADNGDFYRTANGQGIYKLDRNEDDQYMSYASTAFGVYRYHNEYEDSIFTSQIPFIRAAKALDRVFTGDDGLFDIRFLGAEMILYQAAAIWCLVEYAAYGAKRGAGYLVALAAVVIFADTGYSAYFNSFFAEGLVLSSCLMAMSCLLLLTQRRFSPVALTVVGLVNALILTGAKQQNAPLGVLLGLAFLLLPPLLLRRDRLKEPEERYFRRPGIFRGAMIGSAALCLCMGALVYLVIPQEFVNINKYHAMTRGVLMTSDDPEKTLDEFGISRQLSILSKTIYYQEGYGQYADQEQLQKELFDHYNTASVVSYYLKHPTQLFRMLYIAAQNAYSIRPSMGNFAREAGFAAGARTDFFTLHSSVKELVMPRTSEFIVIWFVAALLCGMRDGPRTLLLAVTMLMGISQIVISIVGAGDADLSKHVFLYNVTFDLVNFIGLAAAIRGMGSLAGRFAQKRREKRKAPKKGAVAA